MKFQVQNENELVDKVWSTLGQKAKGGFVCGLESELGAGKTTLVKGLAKKFGIKEEITSPTFVVCKKYGNLQHLDLYRFENAKKADLAEIGDWLSDSQAITFIEWPNLIPGLVSKLDLLIKIRNLGTTRREVELRWC